MVLSPQVMLKIIADLRRELAVKDALLEAKGGLNANQVRRLSNEITNGS